jgi:diguanylate cyclase (GGDEF)-like protein/PAS domain S-box-containing protein
MLQLHRWQFRIRTRLTLLVLALALPFAGYSVLSSVEEARLERAHAGAQLFGIAKVTAARLDDHLNDIRTVLQMLSAVVSADRTGTASNDRLLRTLFDKFPSSVDNVSVWTAAGDEIGTLDPHWRQASTVAASSQRFFADALATGEMSTQAPLASPTTGKPIGAFGVPVMRDGRAVGVVAAAVRLDALQALLTERADLPANAVVTVVDQAGVVIARSRDPEYWVGKIVPGIGASAIAPRPAFEADGVRDGPGVDGVVRIAGVATTRALPWRVYVGLPRDEALAPVHARLRKNLIVAGCFLLFGLLLAAVIGEGIASPLRMLVRDADAFGAGNLDHRCEARGGGEVGVLAGTLNTMAALLEGRARELISTQTQLRQVTDNLPALISYLDVDERFRFVNQVYETWLGRKQTDLLGQSLLEVYGAEAYDRFKGHIHEALTGVRVTYDRALPTLQGTRHVKVTAVPDFDDEGRVKGLFVMMIDMTATHAAEKALVESERRLQTVADNIPALVTYVDRDQRYRFVNAYLGNVFRIDPQRLIGNTLIECGGEKLYAQIAPHVAAALRGEEVVFDGVWTVGDRPFHYQSTYIPDIDPQGTVRGYYAMTFDITALKETQRQLDLLARVDALTGLPNRRQFDERLEEAMARTQRAATSMGVMFLDVDYFKKINDTLGHAAGDVVLKEFGTRLRHQVRVTDVVARLGGDEFVVLVEGIKGIDELEALAEKIVAAVRSPIFFEGRPVPITTSVGVALYEGGGESSAELLEGADRALYAAKREGRDRFSVARPDVVVD